MTETVPVLIIGAGPTGLTMALELSRHDVDFRIIDKKPERTKTSNALGIHPRTLEMLDDMGVIDHFLKLGHRIDAFSIKEGEKNLAYLSTNQIESYYNFILSLPQNHTEDILDKRLNTLGHRIERPKELIELKQENELISATISDPEGNTEIIQCRWLIACDGGHSKVRELTQTPFLGSDIKQAFIVADVRADYRYPDNQITAFFDSDGPFAIFPIRSGAFRIVANLANTNRDPNQPVSQLEVQQIAEKRSCGEITVKDLIWVSPFWIHSKMVSQMCEKNIFFVGDAAHIHSPVGAQGMNTGMQDAYNLAWKLALVIKGESNDALLNSYHQERYPITKNIVDETKKFTKLILIKSPIIRFLRKLFLKTALKFDIVQHNFVMMLSQLLIAYKDSDAIDYQHQVNKHALKAGQHATDVWYVDTEGNEKHLTDIIRGTTHSLLLLTGENPSDEAIEKIKEVAEWANNYNGKLNTKIITHPNVADRFSEHNERDTNANLHKKYKITQPCFYLIRPDKYIGCCSKDIDKTIIKKYLKNIFK